MMRDNEACDCTAVSIAKPLHRAPGDTVDRYLTIGTINELAADHLHTQFLNFYRPELQRVALLPILLYLGKPYSPATTLLIFRSFRPKLRLKGLKPPIKAGPIEIPETSVGSPSSAVPGTSMAVNGLEYHADKSTLCKLHCYTEVQVQRVDTSERINGSVAAPRAILMTIKLSFGVQSQPHLFARRCPPSVETRMQIKFPPSHFLLEAIRLLSLRVLLYRKSFIPVFAPSENSFSFQEFHVFIVFLLDGGLFA